MYRQKIGFSWEKGYDNWYPIHLHDLPHYYQLLWQISNHKFQEEIYQYRWIYKSWGHWDGLRMCFPRSIALSSSFVNSPCNLGPAQQTLAITADYHLTPLTMIQEKPTRLSRRQGLLNVSIVSRNRSLLSNGWLLFMFCFHKRQWTVDGPFCSRRRSVGMKTSLIVKFRGFFKDVQLLPMLLVRSLVWIPFCIFQVKSRIIGRNLNSQNYPA